MKQKWGWRILLGALAFSTLHGDCLRYNEAVALSGTVISHPGIRGWIGLRLDRPLCTVGGRQDAYEVAYINVLETQIAILNNQDINPFIGTKVTITGKLFPRMNGHHETSVLIGMNSIQGLQPLAATTNPDVHKETSTPGTLPDTFHVSITILPKPVDRVTTVAWDNNPRAVLRNSEAYASHMLNGSKDVMWVSCRTGFEIAEAKSTTGSAVFRMDAEDPKNGFWGVAVSPDARTNATIRCVRTR